MLTATAPLLTLPSDVARKQLLSLLRERSFSRRRVVLASGRESDFYIDVKQTSLHSLGSLMIGRLLTEAILAGTPVLAVGGLTLGADPLVTAVTCWSCLIHRPLDGFLVRKQPKGHGTGQWLEGVQHLPAQAAVAIVEDVATTGGSALQAIERAEAHGFRVTRVLAVVDRQEGAVAALAERGFVLESLFTRQDFMGD